MANGIWSTPPEPTRGAATARAFNLSTAVAGNWKGVEYRLPLTHGRVYSEEEIWANYEYFIRQAAPVAGPRLGNGTPRTPGDGRGSVAATHLCARRQACDLRDPNQPPGKRVGRLFGP